MRSIAIEREAGIERQLHVVGAWQIPGFRRDIAGLVVDDEQRAVD